jgi:hypothetical protein
MRVQFDMNSDENTVHGGHPINSNGFSLTTLSSNLALFEATFKPHGCPSSGSNSRMSSEKPGLRRTLLASFVTRGGE